ncbi:unnamed protein product [Clavelina lepadiformis]|uniref:Uncharacterized protein n=1 Tax=Clavelina lepadiformis TaxID=159417 RepID=A0ABP0GI05_CLALP
MALSIKNILLFIAVIVQPRPNAGGLLRTRYLSDKALGRLASHDFATENLADPKRDVFQSDAQVYTAYGQAPSGLEDPNHALDLQEPELKIPWKNIVMRLRSESRQPSDEGFSPMQATTRQRKCSGLSTCWLQNLGGRLNSSKHKSFNMGMLNNYGRR